MPGWRAWGHNPRKGRDQILPSGNLDANDDSELDIDEFAQLIKLSLTNSHLNNDELGEFINSGDIGGVRYIFKVSKGEQRGRETDSPSLFVIQLIRERWSNPGIPSKNESGNCNTVKNRAFVILLILALNYQKKVFDYVSKSYFFLEGMSRFGHRFSE